MTEPHRPITVSKDTAAQVARYEAMLEASARVNHTLLQMKETSGGLAGALQLIGEATAVDRVYVFEMFH